MINTEDLREFQNLYTTYVERQKNVLTLLESQRNVTGQYYNIVETEQNIINITSNLESISKFIKEANKNSVHLIAIALSKINNELEYLHKNFSDQTLHNAQIKMFSLSNEVSSIRISILASSEQNKSFEELIQKYQKTIERLEIDTNTLDFRKTANIFHKQGQSWLISIIIIALILFAACIFFLTQTGYEIQDIKKYNEYFKSLDINISLSIVYFSLLKNILLRIIILAIIIYTLKFATKNYSACMHNKTVNQHKANSLEATDRMIRVIGYDNLEIRMAILNLASKEIFTQETTGYLQKEDKIDFNMIEKLISISKEKV